MRSWLGCPVAEEHEGVSPVPACRHTRCCCTFAFTVRHLGHCARVCLAAGWTHAARGELQVQLGQDVNLRPLRRTTMTPSPYTPALGPRCDLFARPRFSRCTRHRGCICINGELACLEFEAPSRDVQRRRLETARKLQRGHSWRYDNLWVHRSLLESLITDVMPEGVDLFDH